MPKSLELDSTEAQRLLIALYTHRRELQTTYTNIRIVPNNAEVLADVEDEMNSFRLLSGKVAELLSDYAKDKYDRRLRATETFGGALPCVLSKID
jgi:hypothetical protein